MSKPRYYAQTKNDLMKYMAALGNDFNYDKSNPCIECLLDIFAYYCLISKCKKQGESLLFMQCERINDRLLVQFQ